MVSSSCNHEMLAPMRCIIQIAHNLIDKVKEETNRVDLKVIFNTSSFLLNQVQSNLDASLIEQNQLKPRLATHNLKSDVIKPVLDIFTAQAKAQKV